MLFQNVSMKLFKCMHSIPVVVLYYMLSVKSYFIVVKW